MTTKKFHKENYRYFCTEKKFEDATLERMQAYYDKKKADGMTSRHFRVSRSDGVQLIIMFGEEHFEKVKNGVTEENEHGDTWLLWKYEGFEMNDGEKAYILEFITEDLMEEYEQEEADAFTRAYFDIREDDGRYSKYDVYSESELL